MQNQYLGCQTLSIFFVERGVWDQRPVTKLTRFEADSECLVIDPNGVCPSPATHNGSPSDAKTAICELPFGRIASDTVGGAGGTCVLRGCVPKKLMVYGGEFSEAFRDSKAFG